MEVKIQNYRTACEGIAWKNEKLFRRVLRSIPHILPSSNLPDSALQRSIRKFKNVKTEKLILKNRPDTILRKRLGETSLDTAVKVKNTEALRLLLKHGNYKFTDISRALRRATSMLKPDLIKMIEYEPRWIPMRLLLNKSKKSSSCISHYLKNGFRIHPSSQVTKFDLAYRFAEMENLEIVEQMLESGINVNEYNHKTGFTLLHLACGIQNVELVNLLIKHNVNVNAPINTSRSNAYCTSIRSSSIMVGKTALYIVVDLSNIEIMKLLINAGALISKERNLLKQAVRAGNKTMIEFLVSIGVPINEADSEGITPLHYSVIKFSSYYNYRMTHWQPQREAFEDDRNKWPLVKYLLSHGANVDAQTHSRKLTPLHMAVEKNYPCIVKLLLKYGSNLNLLNSENLTPFCVAITKKHNIITDILLKCDIDLNAKNGFGTTPLHVCCVSNDERAVEALLKKKVPIDCVDNYGKTPLHVACEKGNFRIIRHLLNYKANVHIKDNFEQTPFHLFAKLHRKNKWGTEKDIIELCERFISMGVDINLGDVEKKTPFFIACSHGSREIVKVLLKHKANIHQRDVFNIPPIHEAAGTAASGTGILKLLVENNADVDYVDMNKNTILHTAAANNNPDFNEIMKKINFDVDVLNQRGDTPLHIASKNGFFKIVCILINHGADINMLNAENKTPIHVVIDQLQMIQREIDKLYIALRNFSNGNGMIDDRHFHLNCGTDKYRKIIEFLNLWCIKLHKANLYVNPAIFEATHDFTDKDMSKFEDACTQELESMKESRINRTNLYNLLTCHIHDISKFAANKKVKAAIVTRNNSKFPLYHNILKIRFRQGIRRNKQMKFMQLYYYSDLNVFKSLPYSCVDQIFRNLEMKDIRAFEKAVTGRCNKDYFTEEDPNRTLSNL